MNHPWHPAALELKRSGRGCCPKNADDHVNRFLGALIVRSTIPGSLNCVERH